MRAPLTAGPWRRECLLELSFPSVAKKRDRTHTHPTRTHDLHTAKDRNVATANFDLSPKFNPVWQRALLTRACACAFKLVRQHNNNAANTDRCLADMDLRSYCCCGKSTETIATLNCPQNFNLKRLIITRESLKRLCGYAIDSPGRYLDDQVCNVTGEYYG